MASHDLLAKSEQLTLLYCYAAEDQAMLTLLEPYLKLLSNEHVEVKLRGLNMDTAPIRFVESSVQISEAHIILLLVSDAFKRFGDGKNEVMEHILRRERHGEAHVFPVVLRKTRWAGTTFSIMRPLPSNGAALQTHADGSLDQATMAMLLRELQTEIQTLMASAKIVGHSQHAQGLRTPDQAYADNGQMQALAEAEEQSELSTDPVKLLPPARSATSDDENHVAVRPHKRYSWRDKYMTPDRWRRTIRRNAPRVVVVVVVMCLAFSLFLFVVPGREAPIPPTQEHNGIGVHILNGEPIGISDGTIIFDTNRSDAEAKEQAAKALARNDVGEAEQQWGKALNTPEDENDAEAMIYRENQSIADQPYITVVVPTQLSILPHRQARDTLNTGRLILQGAYMVQKEVNQRNLLPNQLKLRVLIGNAGDTAGHARELAAQILRLRESDKTFVGVMGWPISTKETLDAINLLVGQHVTMISPTASSIELNSTTSAPYFFRVSPNDAAQAEVAARFLKSSMKIERVAVFRDPTNPYSNTLSDQFCRSWIGLSCEAVPANPSLKAVTFQRDKAASMSKALDQALSLQPQLLYFAGYSDDLRLLQASLQQAHRQLPIMGGDALYVLGEATQAYYKNLFFTAFTYPDIWNNYDIASNQNHKPQLYATFAQTFDHLNVHAPGVYNYTRPQNDVVLSYDAMYTLINGCQVALRTHASCSSEELRNALLQFDGTSPTRTFQGASGQISFQADGNAKDKTVVVLCANGRGLTRLIGVYNRFLVGGPLLDKTYSIDGCK